MSFDHLFKVIIFGVHGVGKSCLITKFVDNTFSHETISTIGVDFRTKDIEIDNQTIRLQLWDTAGQERYRVPFTSSIYKNAQGFIIVYDLTNYNSLEEVEYFIHEIEDNCSENVEIVLAGNKSDLPNQIENPEAELLKYTKGKEYKTFRTSAKDGSNVTDLFHYIASQLKEKPMDANPLISDDEHHRNVIRLDSDETDSENDPQPKPKKKPCC
ncbi:ras-related protein rab-37 [Anaeramoeba ignava]|uniref:Ras-related protein rab-37 n=1 Tax=Anaeramoeba ignava TaxID=1746090 RepID=A0A9Q0REE3_ANAIG|nr:ras-related protein rab-37 [Anaeramoeba ignava]